MYTYNCVFVGIPLSQNSRIPSWLQALGNLVSEYDLSDIGPGIDLDSEFEDDIQHDEVRQFLTWISSNQEAVKSLKYVFQKNYHGGDDEPIIFGRYVDEWFPIPDFGASRMNLEHLDKLKDLEERSKRVFESLPPLIKDDILNLLGIWFNNHSS